ncbi:hypothetical protein NE237_023777 [Protea cynaroides]|uniref:Allene oxide synthase n=1 Tax=Protea cynaroides TaxID=273540 RepID=A0A9Q0HCR8_9MAGN|nr:hypothetical protein NE237_023777 [Protea cynaroides]
MGSTTEANPALPIRKIPGNYGLPIIGPFKDQWDYFHNQGLSIHGVCANVPPGPFIESNPYVTVLDGKSFPVLFDTSKVEKRGLFHNNYSQYYIPSTKFSGGYRILSYLDPSEPNHTKLKNLVFFLLRTLKGEQLAIKGKVAFGDPNDNACFNFLGQAFYGVDPTNTKLGKNGPTLIAKWILFQLLPPFLIKSDYKKLYDFFYNASGKILDEGEKMGIQREEACHNLLSATCFNSYGGIKILFPSLLKFISQAGVKLQKQLAEEIRTVVQSNGGKVTMSGIEQMELMNSVVFETLRIDPPVPLQYGKAKKDLVKKGEILFGFQPFPTKDPNIFSNGEEFVAERFMGKEGEKLLKNVFWSNGPETDNPSVENKQCAGKNFIVLVGRFLMVELFMRYDTFEVTTGTSALGSTVTLTWVKRASLD